MYDGIYRVRNWLALSRPINCYPYRQALDALSKKDIAEIRSFTHPPPRVEMVMEAVMILKASEPTWAESKRQLADVNFLNTVGERERSKDLVLSSALCFQQNFHGIFHVVRGREFSAARLRQGQHL